MSSPIVALPLAFDHTPLDQLKIVRTVRLDGGVMERPHLRPIQNRLLAVEVAGIAMFSPSAWAGGAIGLGTGAVVGATVGAPATGAVIGGLVGTGIGYTVGISLKNSENHRGGLLI